MRERIINRIKLVDYGDFYKWEIERPHCRTTTQGFCSITAGMDILKENIDLIKKTTYSGE